MPDRHPLKEYLLSRFRYLLQQSIRMHAAQLLSDRVLWPVFLLRQPLDPPDLGKKLANLFPYVIAILLGHLCSSDRSSNAIP
jgi:hypothetical protein